MYCSKPDKATFDYVEQYLNLNSDENIFINILTVDVHGPYPSNLLREQTELEAYTQKALKSIDDISNFIGNILKQESKRTFSILLTSDHPPHLTSLVNKNAKDLKKYNFNFLIEKI